MNVWTTFSCAVTSSTCQFVLSLITRIQYNFALLLRDPDMHHANVQRDSKAIKPFALDQSNTPSQRRTRRVHKAIIQWLKTSRGA